MKRTLLRNLMLLILFYTNVRGTNGWVDPYEEIERIHNPFKYLPSRSLEVEGGVQIPDPRYTPDFREGDPLRLPRHQYDPFEENVIYRLSPHYIQTTQWASQRRWENMHNAGCVCTTVYKRYTPLATCALVTTRHLLTTATSTYTILRTRSHYPTLEGILGAWYDTNHYNYNSSMYLSPSRIHYHPKWQYPEQVNRSHPFSFTFDLAVWATTYNIYGWYLNGNSAQTCLRATGHVWELLPPTPRTELFVVIGYQYVIASERKPMPWFKYGVRTWYTTVPCPKTDWGWFICIKDRVWGRFGVESGTALHRTFQGYSWRYDGLIAMAAFSMKLRSEELNHYFTVLDCHPVLDFLYDAYYGLIPNVWLDKRFNDSQYSAPIIRTELSFWIPRVYPTGDQHYRPLPIFDKRR